MCAQTTRCGGNLHCVHNFGSATTTTTMSHVLKSASALALGPWKTQDPFLFCVYHLDDFPAGEANLAPPASVRRGRSIGQDFSRKDGFSMYHGEIHSGFPKHPHRGFETITITRKGMVDHADSMGCAGRFGLGDCQWMTAGKGISHSEMFPLLKQDEGNPLELFQIWLNLPKKDKMVDPAFKMLWAENIPTKTFVDDKGKKTTLTCYAGVFEDTESKLEPPAPTPSSWATDPDNHVCVWTMKLEPGATWTLPASDHKDDAKVSRTIYVFSPWEGVKVSVSSKAVGQPAMLELRPEMDAELHNHGETDCEILMLQGRAISEPVVQYGPFVMSTQPEIKEAFSAYQDTDGFGKWKWGSDAPVHDATRSRFAQYPDGTLETRT